MKTINIDLGDRSYPIYVGDQLIDNPTILLNHIHTHTVVVVTNTTVAPLYLITHTSSLLFCLMVSSIRIQKHSTLSMKCY
jgi:3-dehydroquinate synthase